MIPFSNIAMILRKVPYVRVSKYCTVANDKKSVKYTDTVHLPKTKFPQYLKTEQIVQKDKRIFESAEFDNFYTWQKKNKRGQEFSLLDGPPYANGRVHIGHAINKILKDIILRSKLIRGHRVHFTPGWDCHGLPIELKAQSKKLNAELSPIEIRRRARDFAKNAAAQQMEAFRCWGVLADWKKEVYYTYDSAYVTRQLQLFWSMYEQGLLYRDLKPVYWSPSSRTALAEAELVYKDNHVSDAVTVRLRLVNHNLNSPATPVYILIWTTTPWTLPVNEAACFSKELEYSLVSIAGLDGLYIVASSLVEELQAKWQQEVKIIEQISTDILSRLEYEHPWRNDAYCKVVDSNHVSASGTGFVHVAPAHGHDDFLVGLKHKLTRDCFVDGEGRYTNEAGSDLAGLAVISEGSQFVLERLSSNIIHHEKYTHSYPYDWRTDQPVIIRASQQWFVDTATLKESALECLANVKGPTERLRSLLSSRPYWCISRQRVWGVPIPAFYHKTSGRPLLSKSVVDSLCRHIEEGDADAWWTLPESVLFPSKACQELCVHVDDVKRGEDIMDIWFDSGVAWSTLPGEEADVVIEGGDQHTGWFQSSLLTCVAIRGWAPAKQLLTHGFAVDESGRKMSKSVGNVVDPQKAVKEIGVDALRWWVASHSHHSLVPASDRHLQASKEIVMRLRGTIRFLLGALHNLKVEELNKRPISVIDRYLLHTCHSLYTAVMKDYDNYSWNYVCTQLVNFTSGPVSALYLHVIKDRLYCDSASSLRRASCRTVLTGILETLMICLAPVMPALAEEIYQYHPLASGKFWYQDEHWSVPNSWVSEVDCEIMETALKLKAAVDKITSSTGTTPLSCNLSLSDSDASALKVMQENEESWDSELTELFQVASVRIDLHGKEESTVQLTASPRLKCPRCRRHTCSSEKPVCNRCEQVLLK